MSTEITIGADELILWLRKNKKAKEMANDEGLGRKIHDLIVNELSGEKVIPNHPSHWSSLIDDKNVGKLGLPKTSAQYKIETNKLGELYETLNGWEF